MSRPRRAAALGGGIAAGSLLLKDALGYSRSATTCKDAAATKTEDEKRPYVVPSRESQIQKLKSEAFDVLVIGGGCVGAGVALDAQVRGLKTAMVEGNDFAAGTSGRSTKLIHGGVRYLETAFWKMDYGSYSLVQEALEERAHMLAAAPYMNHPLPIMIPIYKWWEVPYFLAGAKAYDLVARKQRSVPPSHFITAKEASAQFPMLRKEGLKGAIVYFDGQMNDTRMALMVALTSTQKGATIANRVKVTELIKGSKGQVEGAKVQDLISGDEWTIKAKAVVNATGVFADSIRKMDDPKAVELIEPASGVHVVFPSHYSPSRMGLIVPKTTDGRVLFLLPWEGCTLAGTTDAPSEISMAPKPTIDEVNWIMTETNQYLSSKVTTKDIIGTWSGLRPLVKDPEKVKEGTKGLSRNHVIEVSPSKLVTVTGGKWTTYRRMAQDTIDRVLKEKPELKTSGHLVSQKSLTWNMPLLGADPSGSVCDQKFDKIYIVLRNDYALPEDVALHLVKCYGTRALQIGDLIRQGYLDVKPNQIERLNSRYPILEAEAVFAVQQEYALEPMDTLARRTRLAFLDVEAATNALPRVVKIMGDLLNWSKKKREEETQKALEFLITMNIDKTKLSVK